MKKNNFYLFLCLLLSSVALAQTTELFETETSASTSFTDNSQVFNITSQARGPFDIQASYPGTGWSGTAADNRYIDNDGNAGTGFTVGFTISSAGAVPFKLNSMYMFFSNAASLNQAVPGSLTIVGKLGGVTKFSATQSSGFVTSLGTNNGFTFINMATFGSQNNANTLIDQVIFTTGGQYEYVALDAFNWTASAPLVATITGTNVACNGANTGAASVSASGGVSPYTYAWAPSGGSGATASSLTAGTYTCTITDNASTQITRTISITQPSALSTVTSFTNTSCFGGGNGRASVAVTGGTGAYTYTWAPSGGTASLATGLSAGNYTVTVTDANSCTRTQTATVTQPSAIGTATAVTNVACNGGSNGVAAVSASGGAGGYSYSWAPSGGTGAVATGRAAGVYTVTVTDANSCVRTAIATVTQPSALTTSTAVTNVACNGGSNGVASISASGGAGGYTYLWSTGATTSAITGLLAGAYSATVTDANSCTSIKGTTVTQPSALITSTAVTNVACNGGSNGVASITASGGAGGYTYLWSTGATTSAITGLLAGAYSATVTDANSCTSIKGATVTQPSALITSTAVTNVACNGGSNGVASITASGGAGGYTYLWSTGATTSAITGLLAGVYSATVTDANSCTSIKGATVTQPSALTTSTAVTNVACNGGSNGVASITASGGAGGYTYLWSTGATTSAITGLMAGAYSATVTDANSCTSIKGATVTQPSAIGTTTSVTSVSCNGGSNGVATVSASGGAGGFTYSWAPSGGTGATASGLTANNYTVTITDANSCTKTAFATITQPTAISTPTSVTNVSCNGGSNGVATVSASGGAGGFTYSWAPSGGTGATASGLTANNYTVTITDVNSCTKTAMVNVTQPTAIATTTSVTNVSCNGGSNGIATVSASGGAGGFTYSWTPSGGTGATASGLSVNNYTVMLTDANSCTKTATVNVTQPTLITATPSQTNATCGTNNGAASVVVSGGAGGYTYSWTPTGGTAATASTLGAGTYTAIITDANSCIKTQTFNITASGNILGVITTTAVSCNGGNNGVASVTASGGTGAFTYTWMPGNISTPTTSGLTSGIYTVQIKDATSCTVTFTANVSQPLVLNASTTFTNISCNGASNGIATVSVSGGTGTYTYTWAPTGGNAATASGLIPGTYTVNVKDANNCTLSRTVSISQPLVLSATITGTNISCGGGTNGTASVTVSGGTGAYTYSWTPTGGTAAMASGLAANNYTVTIKDANLCTLTSTITLTEPASMTAVTSQTNLTCNGSNNGAANISVSGGAGSYTYSWTPSGGTAATATGLAANIYTVTVKDANTCSISLTYTITQPAVVVIAMSHTNVTCNGAANGIATVIASGGTGAYTYSWTPGTATVPGITGLAPGMYTVTVKDANACQSTATVLITEPTALAATTTQTNAACNGAANASASVSVSGGTGAYSYTWVPTGGNASSATALTAGNYSVMVSDANSCMLTQTLTITEPAAILATLSHTNISCFGLTNGSASVTATGGSGALTYTWMPGSSNATSISGLIAGTYTVNVKDASNCQVSSTVTIIEPAAIAYTQSLSVCQGQSVMVGASAYSVAGTYTNVLVSSGGCDSTVTTVLTLNAPPTLTVTASSSTLCAGSSATLTASGATTYTWTNGVTNGVGFNPSSTQVYTVTGANGGCIVTVTIGLTVNPKPTVTANATSTLICKGNAVTLSGGGATTYTWSNGVINGTAFNPTTTVTYTVTGTNTSGCTNTAVATVSVNPCLGIENYNSAITVMVYPNPVNSTAVISISNFDQLASGKLSLDLYDNTGRIVKQLILSGAETNLSREGLADGLYYYSITNNGAAIQKGKLIIQ